MSGECLVERLNELLTNPDVNTHFATVANTHKLNHIRRTGAFFLPRTIMCHLVCSSLNPSVVELAYPKVSLYPSDQTMQLSFRPFALSCWITCLSLVSCPSNVLQSTMSAKNPSTSFRLILPMTLCINRWQVVGAFVMPWAMQLNS